MAIGYKILVPTSAKPALPMVNGVERFTAAPTCYRGVFPLVAAESHTSGGCPDTAQLSDDGHGATWVN